MLFCVEKTNNEAIREGANHHHYHRDGGFHQGEALLAFGVLGFGSLGFHGFYVWGCRVVFLIGRVLVRSTTFTGTLSAPQLVLNVTV